jgi:hypothetical protein
MKFIGKFCSRNQLSRQGTFRSSIFSTAGSASRNSIAFHTLQQQESETVSKLYKLLSCIDKLLTDCIEHRCLRKSGNYSFVYVVYCRGCAHQTDATRFSGSLYVHLNNTLEKASIPIKREDQTRVKFSLIYFLLGNILCPVYYY